MTSSAKGGHLGQKVKLSVKTRVSTNYLRMAVVLIKGGNWTKGETKNF